MKNLDANSRLHTSYPTCQRRHPQLPAVTKPGPQQAEK